MTGMPEHQGGVPPPGRFEGIEYIGIFRDIDLEFLPVAAAGFSVFGAGCAPDLKRQWLIHDHSPRRYDANGVVRVWVGVVIPSVAQTRSLIFSAI